ncbi:MAG: flagellar filament capping protein FliD [bacterium]|nr:flagellar filament capping protein FliD [bacterium]
MAGVISIGGLATGLDTNSIIDQLVKLERRPIDVLVTQVADAEKTKGALSTLSGKLLNLKRAIDRMKVAGDVLVRKASSSDQTVLTAAAGSGAQRGTATLTVTQLARGSVAGATVGRESVDATVAGGAGTFRFQVGSGDVQTVVIDETTTLQGLANAINEKNAGVTATAINAGTAAAPDWRLQLASKTTGASTTITVVQDDTQLAIQTAQTGRNAQFTVSGFATGFERETNTFADVLPGVTISLKAEGTSTLTVDDDTDAIVDRVKAIVAAYNDVRTFVDANADVTKTSDDELRTGPLAANVGVRQLLARVQEVFTGAVGGATPPYVNLASLGLATQRDGTILLDESKLRAAIGADPDAVARLFAGGGDDGGVANALSTLLDDLTKSSGSLSLQTDAIDRQVRSLEDAIAAGERNLGVFEKSLREQFAVMEQLVSSLQTQSNFLLAALGK